MIKTYIILLKEFVKYKKTNLLYLVLNAFFYSLVVIMNIFGPSAVFNAVVNKDIFKIILYIFFYVIISFLCNFILSKIDSYINVNVKSFRLHYLRLFHDKRLSINYSNLENKDFLNNLHMIKTGLILPHIGVEAILKKTFDISKRSFSILLCIIVLFNISVVLPFFIIIFLTISYLYNLKQNKKILEIEAEESMDYRKKFYMEDVFTENKFTKEIKIFNIYSWLISRYDNIFNNTIVSEKKKESFRDKFRFLDNIINFLLNIISFIYIVLKVSSFSEFLVYFSAITSFTNNTVSLFSDISLIYTELNRVEKFDEFMADDMIMPFLEKENTEDMLSEKYEIEFRNVSFKYENSKTNIFNDLNIKIKSNEKIGIIGLNGAGKTTFVKLLLRLYKPDKGNIYINNKDIQTINYDDYLKIFSVVLQSTNLITSTLAENIALNEEYDEMKLLKAIEISGFKNTYDTLENGLLTNISKDLKDDSIDFSGGERQKIFLSRAIYDDSPILILDEPASALDIVSEELFYKNIADNISNKTVLFISHRMFASNFYDKILLIEEHQSYFDTHDVLYENHSLYRKIIKEQKKYYEEASDNEPN